MERDIHIQDIKEIQILKGKSRAIAFVYITNAYIHINKSVLERLIPKVCMVEKLVFLNEHEKYTENKNHANDGNGQS